MIRVLHVEHIDKTVLVTLEHPFAARHADVKSAAINAALDAGLEFELGTERISGRGNVSTFSWEALTQARAVR